MFNNMKAIPISIIFLSFATLANGKFYYILTRFNDIQEYALKVMQYSDFDYRDLQCTKKYITLYNYCSSLLAAPVFEISSEVNPLTRVDTGFHTIDIDARAELSNQCEKGSNLRAKLCHIAGNKFMLPTYNCINHDSRFNWLVFHPNSASTGLLFTTIPVNTIYALIDQTVKMTARNAFIISDFRKSLNKTVSPYHELLCNLKKISQFRLCSICADGIHRRNLINGFPTYIRPSENPDLEEFADPHFNYVVDGHYGTPDNCPNITISILDQLGLSEIRTTALYCDVSIKDVIHQFHVKASLNGGFRKADIVYILRNGKIKGEIPINQLQNIFTIDARL